MSAISFVVRDVAGNISRGSVSGEGVPSSLVVGAGADVSLNLTRGQIVSYTRQGQALEITLIDGRVITIEGYFTTEGVAENQLFISADGFLTEVQLNQGAGADYFANYVEGDGLGKFAMNDDLYFMRGADVMLAGDYVPADDEVGMLGTALGGLGGLFGWGGAAAAGGAAIIGGIGGGGGGPDAPEVSITSGTEGSEHVVNEEDHSDGVEIGGEGTPGATVEVTVGGVTETTVISEEGTWEVIFDSSEVDTGEYSTGVSVVVTNEGGSTTVTDTLIVDTEVDVTFNSGAVEGDGVINAVENADGTTLTGTIAGGSSVVVTVAGVDYNATVTGGSWSVDVPAGAISGGEYDLGVVVTATDAFGNSTSTSGTVIVDTVTHVTLSTASVGGADNVVNGVEQPNGVTLTGTAQPNASVAVTFGAVTTTVMASSSGAWSATFSGSDVPTGELDVPVMAVATDGAQNTATATGSVGIDTLVNELEITTGQVGGDGTVNGSESGQAVTVGGTVEAGSSVVVTLHNTTMNAVVDGNGNWTATFPAGALPTGEYNTTMAVTATDQAGNTSTLSEAVMVDTFVNRLTSADPIAEDNIVSGAEASAGITLNGTVEAGSTVFVSIQHEGGTVTEEATVDTFGNWTVNFGPGVIPDGEYDANVTISATDAVGNTDQITDTFRVDTISPEAPAVDSVTIKDDAVERVEIAASSDAVEITEVTAAGGTNIIATDADGFDTGWDTTIFNFDQGLPDGSHLVVTETDTAGNASSTYVVLEETGPQIVDTATGLGDFDVGAIDLSFAKETDLTLDLATLQGLSDADNNLVIHGGADDMVSLQGATATNTSTAIGDHVYDIYTMGDGEVMIDQDINVNVTN